MIKFIELHDLLVGYVGFYLEFYYNKKFKNRKIRQQKIDRFLKDLKKIKVDNSTFPIQKFKFFFEIWAYVEEWCGGYRLYRFIVMDFGSSDYSGAWNRQWL